jgi:hypothetical protein
MNFLKLFKHQTDNGSLTLEGFLAEKEFTSAIPFYYSGHGLSVRIDGKNASIRDNDEGGLLYSGSKQDVKQELEILLDNSRRD